ncbi:PAX-interacting protein 1 [Quaeritorhiza haematococci]|nr:PAX-interacting protein 1 [Quaeritorhiza haematococci]
MKIAITNYIGRGREQIREMMTHLGAEYTGNMTDVNTHLICAAPVGEKYEMARLWNLHIVNHLWLEETYTRWTWQREARVHYLHFPGGLSDIVGSSSVPPEEVERWVETASKELELKGSEPTSDKVLIGGVTAASAVAVPKTEEVVTKPKPLRKVRPKSKPGTPVIKRSASGIVAQESRPISAKKEETFKSEEDTHDSPLAPRKRPKIVHATDGKSMVSTAEKHDSVTASKAVVAPKLRAGTSEKDSSPSRRGARLQSETTPPSTSSPQARTPTKGTKITIEVPIRKRSFTSSPHPSQEPREGGLRGTERPKIIEDGALQRQSSKGLAVKTCKTPPEGVQGDKQTRSGGSGSKKPNKLSPHDQENKRNVGSTDSSPMASQNTRRKRKATEMQNARRVRLMFTAARPSEDEEKKLKAMGAEMAKSISDSTHLIAAKVVRTEKFLMGICSVPFILNEKWIKDSVSAFAFADETQYFLEDEAAETRYKFSLRESIRKAAAKKLLDGYSVLCTPKVNPDKDTMKRIIENAGGKLLPRKKNIEWMKKVARGNPAGSANGNVIVISCSEDRDYAEALTASGVTVYTTELLLTGLLRQELDLDNPDFYLYLDDDEMSEGE